jgi:hypothetical protein
MKIKASFIGTLGCRKGQPRRDINSYECLHQKLRDISNK